MTGRCDAECVEKVESEEWTLDPPPAVDPPTPPVPATTYARVMSNEQVPIEDRLEAASQLQANFGQQGQEIVENWREALRLASEASIDYQLRNSFGESWKAGGELLREKGVTGNVSICVFVFVTFGTSGFSAGFLSAGKGGRWKAGFGATAYVTVGTPPSSGSVGAMYCDVICGGAYKNVGSGGGVQFGVGTPGLFLGPSLPLPWGGSS